MSAHDRFCVLKLSVPEPPKGRSAAQNRLAEAFSRLQGIQLVRNHLQDPHFGRAVEHRIVWRELLDLELQEIDDCIQRAARPTIQRGIRLVDQEKQL